MTQNTNMLLGYGETLTNPVVLSKRRRGEKKNHIHMKRINL